MVAILRGVKDAGTVVGTLYVFAKAGRGGGRRCHRPNGRDQGELHDFVESCCGRSVLPGDAMVVLTF